MSESTPSTPADDAGEVDRLKASLLAPARRRAAKFKAQRDEARAEADRLREDRDFWQGKANHFEASERRLRAEVETLTDACERSDRLAAARLAKADNLRVTLGKVAAKHAEAYPGAGWCAGCHDAARNEEWPCPTTAILAADPVSLADVREGSES